MSIEGKRIPFTEEDERKIASAGLWGMIVSITGLVTGGFALLAGLAAARSVAMAIGPLVTAGATVLMNLWLLQASLALRKVARSDVADQSLLLSGFRRLRSYFMAQVIFVLVLVAFGFLNGIVRGL